MRWIVFLPWREKLLVALEEKCEVLFSDPDSAHHSFLSSEGMEELKQIHKDMVITYEDKSAHDFVLCCKHVYKHLLWSEIHTL